MIYIILMHNIWNRYTTVVSWCHIFERNNTIYNTNSCSSSLIWMINPMALCLNDHPQMYSNIIMSYNLMRRQVVLCFTQNCTCDRVDSLITKLQSSDLHDTREAANWFVNAIKITLITKLSFLSLCNRIPYCNIWVGVIIFPCIFKIQIKTCIIPSCICKMFPISLVY